MHKKLVIIMTYLAAYGGVVHAAQPLPWPDSGHFPGYPAAPDDGDNWDVSVSAGYANDSNLFRLSDDESASAILGTSQRSDSIWRLGAGVHGNLPVSRQKLLLDLQFDNYNFDHFGFLDYTGHDAALTWDWQAGKLWDGDLGFSHRRYLSSFTTLQDNVQDLIDESHAYLSAGRMIHPRWRAETSLDTYDYEHSASSRSVLDNQMVTGALALQYLTPAENKLGVKMALSAADYPNQEVVQSSLVDNQYEEIEVSGITDWRVTGVSRFNGRLGYTNRQHNEISERDFSGATYELEYQWTPLGSTTFLLSAYRDLRSYADVSANYILTRGLSAGAAWAPTYRTVLQAELINEDWDFRGDTGISLAGTPERQDSVQSGRLTAGYMIFDNTRLKLSYEHGIRDSNIDTAEYDYDLVSGSVEARF